MATARDAEAKKSADYITQYAESIVDFSSQYGSDTTISYSALNLAGRPSIYPAYGDFTLAFVLRTYGPWWESSPCAPEPFKERFHHKYDSQDFVELKFEKKVYPIRIDVFETYNPGAIVRILACDTTSFRWKEIWSGAPHPIPYTEAHIFSPPLLMINFATDLIRIEFYHRHLEYYTELDAVMLTGLAELPSKGSDPLVISRAMYSNPPDQAGLNLLCSRMGNLSVAPSLNLTGICHAKDLILETYQKNRKNYFELLPTEVIQLIINFLDLQSLCQTACTCRLLQKQCYDSLLYTEVDLQPSWHKVTSETLEGLQTRCANIQRLNLSWCGNYGKLSAAAVINFLKACGSNLLSIRFSNCKFVVNDILRVLSEVAPGLEDLDLRSCLHANLDWLGFRQISKLTKLKRLNFYRTRIDLKSILIILRSCPDLEFLNLGACVMVSNFDDVALEIGRSCRQLRGLDLWRAKTLTAIGLRAIADGCPHLKEIDLGWCTEVSSNNGCIVYLVQKCCNLQKLFLTALRSICDNDILNIAKFCPKMEQLDILGNKEVSTVSLLRLLKSCQHLKFLDISYCCQVDYVTYRQWQQDFPDISIKKSFQS